MRDDAETSERPESKRVDEEAPSPVPDGRQPGAEQVESVGHCGFEDPEGWLAESERYWVDLANSMRPTRASWLRHRTVEAWRQLRSMFKPNLNSVDFERVPDSVWTALFEAEVGPLSNGPPAPATEQERGGQEDQPIFGACAAKSRAPEERRSEGPIPFSLDRRGSASRRAP